MYTVFKLKYYEIVTHLDLSQHNHCFIVLSDESTVAPDSRLIRTYSINEEQFKSYLSLEAK